MQIRCFFAVRMWQLLARCFSRQIYNFSSANSFFSLSCSELKEHSSKMETPYSWSHCLPPSLLYFFPSSSSQILKKWIKHEVERWRDWLVSRLSISFFVQIREGLRKWMYSMNMKEGNRKKGGRRMNSSNTKGMRETYRNWWESKENKSETRIYERSIRCFEYISRDFSFLVHFSKVVCYQSLEESEEQTWVTLLTHFSRFQSILLTICSLEFLC